MTIKGSRIDFILLDSYNTVFGSSSALGDCRESGNSSRGDLVYDKIFEWKRET